MNRWWFWLLCLLAIACCLVADAIRESLASPDLSAMAWVGFLPFIAPMFLLQSAMYVLPVAIVFELIYYLRGSAD